MVRPQIEKDAPAIDRWGLRRCVDPGQTYADHEKDPNGMSGAMAVKPSGPLCIPISRGRRFRAYLGIPWGIAIGALLLAGRTIT